MKISPCSLQPANRFLTSTFQFSYPLEPPESLQESIRKVGVLTPLLCVEEPEGLRIFDGHRRYHVARGLGMASIPTSLLIDTSSKDLAQMWLRTQLAVRSLNVFEIAALLEKSVPCFGLPREVMRRLILTERAFPVSPALLKDFPGLLKLPEPFKQAAVSRRYSPSFLVKVVRLYSQPLIEIVTSLMKSLEFSENQLDLLLEWMEDIIERDGGVPADLIKSNLVSFVLSHPKMSAAKKRDALFRAVWTLRFPERSHLQDRFKELQQKVASLGDLRLVAPRDLMGDRFELRIGFRKAQELQTLLKRLTQLSETVGKGIERL